MRTNTTNPDKRARELARLVLRAYADERKTQILFDTEFAVFDGAQIVTGFVVGGRKFLRLVAIVNNRPIYVTRGIRIPGKIGKVHVPHCERCADNFWAHRDEPHEIHEPSIYDEWLNKITR